MKEERWRRGWDSNPVGVLKARNLLILRAAPDAGTAGTAVVGYSLGTGKRAATLSLLVLALLSPLLLAQERRTFDAPKPKPQTKKVFYIGTAALAGSTVADAVTTRQLLNRHGFERSPIFGKNPSPTKQAGINAAFFAGTVAVFYLTERSHNRVIRWIGRSWVGLETAQHSYLAMCNSGINARSPVQQTCGLLVPF